MYALSFFPLKHFTDGAEAQLPKNLTVHVFQTVVNAQVLIKYDTPIIGMLPSNVVNQPGSKILFSQEKLEKLLLLIVILFTN